MSVTGKIAVNESSTGDLRQRAPAAVHLAFIDGLRALAATWVILGHLEMFVGYHHQLYGIKGAIVNWIAYAHLPVDAFIVISGFCLIIPSANTIQIKGGSIGFFLRRARRILPPLYAALFLSILYHVLVDHFGSHTEPLGSPKAILANIFLLQDYLVNYNVYNVVLWSVAAEWKIYFLFPLFVYLLRRRGPGAMLGAAAVLALLHTLIVHYFEPHRSVVSFAWVSPWYILLFGFGVLSGYLSHNQRLRQLCYDWAPKLLAVSAVVLVATFSLSPIGYGSGMTAFVHHVVVIDILVGAAVAIALAFIATGHGQSARRLLENRPLVFLGMFSYSVYLTHYSALYIFRVLINKVHILVTDIALRDVVFVLVGVPFAFAFAYVFFLVFEKPFLTKRKHETQSEVARDVALSPAP